jgi:small subunit ribosomal protein S6e
MAEEIKCNISSPKDGKSYSKPVDKTVLDGRKVGETIPGNLLGLTGYELKVTGGSDAAGFPMRPEIPTTHRKRILVQTSIGVKVKKKGEYKRKTVRGNIVSEATAQLNLSVSKYGTKSIPELLNPEVKEEAPAEKKE